MTVSKTAVTNLGRASPNPFSGYGPHPHDIVVTVLHRTLQIEPNRANPVSAFKRRVAWLPSLKTKTSAFELQSSLRFRRFWHDNSGSYWKWLRVAWFGTRALLPPVPTENFVWPIAPPGGPCNNVACPVAGEITIRQRQLARHAREWFFDRSAECERWGWRDSNSRHLCYP
jgi:hypothetical protein